MRDEAENVYLKLGRSLEEGRKAVSRIVGRDTEALDRSGVIKACVETVAESTTDGVVSPMIAYCAGGAPLSLLYKAINTMDSMIGYKNERYRFFGTAAARLDDAANLLGARIAALCMIFSAGILRLFSFITGRVYVYRPLNALLVFARDRYCHQSPNSAQTESTCAGALGVQLAGDAFYEGVCEHKPTLGDELRPVHIGDIRHSVVLMYAASVLAVLLCTGVKLLVLSAFL
ncbi:MAG: cobalamin biosynthesis protein [Treponema sp.]|nr:cobalamin biosynthesis protein [Treponema sp.]